ncbi:hypothetical protein QCE73_36385 [Caballeronia sp. LZ029]|nr:hypothetical protein [Caballeronia sp. LZ029]
MEQTRKALEPISIVRPRGSHRIETFSPKMNRRLTLYRRSELDLWVRIETDPTVRSFCERPGYVQYDGHRQLADFLVAYRDGQEILLLTERELPDDLRYDGNVENPLTIQSVRVADLAASRAWIDNWKRMLPCIVITRGLLSNALLDGVEHFLTSPQPLAAVERKFSGGDPILARAATFALLYAGRVSAPTLRTTPLSSLTPFVCHGI